MTSNASARPEQKSCSRSEVSDMGASKFPDIQSKTGASDSARPHPFLIDDWLVESVGERSIVHSSRIANVTRAGTAVRDLARVVYNSLREPAATGADPLGRVTELTILDAMFCLGDYIFEQTEQMRETARFSADIGEGA